MIIIKEKKKLQDYLNIKKAGGNRIGFVPTMGALHDGHISLLASCRRHMDVSVCSIFVNPAQFNNREDLEKYPRSVPQDILLLEKSGCDVLFLPEEKDLYEGEVKPDYTFGGMDTVFEGASRPGHFMGVARVVRLLFDAVNPDMAFFGEKDYQQCLIIRSLTSQLNLPVELKFVETRREDNGLAMSSRNRRLSPELRSDAGIIYQALLHAKASFGIESPEETENKCRQMIASRPHFKVDYFRICDAQTLKNISRWEESPGVVALVAVYAGNIRLIDNLSLKKA
jgi:pantoate--beta-alanine ligase